MFFSINSLKLKVCAPDTVAYEKHAYSKNLGRKTDKILYSPNEI